MLAEKVRARILGEGLVPGERLPSEAELMEQHQFSRGTVREALRLLEADGLIEIRRGPHGGITVRHPDSSQVSRSLALLLAIDETPLRSLFDFRIVIEPHVAGEAARTATDEQRASLLSLAEAGCRHYDRLPEFHGALGEAATNNIFRLVLAAVHQILEWHVHMEAISEAEAEQTADVHVRIARAIKAGQPDAAEALMRKHLEAFRALMEQQGRLDAPIVQRSRWRAHLRDGVAAMKGAARATPPPQQ